jgi:chromosome segregation ATPase
MDKLTAVEADLTKAREALTALQNELPQFHALLTDNEGDAQRLKSERAPLDAQAQARGRVQIAKEMLEQHQSDIATARAEVVRLEASKNRELTLAKMAEHAQQTSKHHKTLEKAVHEGSETLGRTLVTMAQAFAGIHDERAAFALLGQELAPEFYRKTPFTGGIEEQAKKAVCEALLSELEAQGANLTDVLNTNTGRHTPIDSETRPLPTPEYGELLWQVFNEAVAKDPQQRSIYHEVYLPVKRNAAPWIPVTASSDDRYQI